MPNVSDVGEIFKNPRARIGVKGELNVSDSTQDANAGRVGLNGNDDARRTCNFVSEQIRSIDWHEQGAPKGMKRYQKKFCDGPHGIMSNQTRIESIVQTDAKANSG